MVILKLWYLVVCLFDLSAVFYVDTIGHGPPWWCAGAFGLAAGTVFSAGVLRK